MIYYNQQWLRKKPFIWFLKSLGGLSIWPYIWFYADKKDVPDSLLVHELEHHKQQKRDFFIWYFIRYWLEYFINRIKGMDSYQAYYNISYEIDARKVADGR